MSAGGREPSRSPRRGQQVEHTFAGCVLSFRPTDRLNTDMVGAGVPMLLDAGADRTFVAPRHHRIEKAVSSPAGKIGVTKALASPPIDIVF